MKSSQKHSADWDIIIIGAGAAGLMAAIAAGKRKKRVLVLDHGKKAGAKIAVSGGGRCNFTNTNTSYEHYISNNPKFCISALNSYTPWDFIALLDNHNINYHEKKIGQLFCDGSAKQIVQLLHDSCLNFGVCFAFESQIKFVKKNRTGFLIKTNQAQLQTSALIIATGGLSFPKLGATDFGHKLASQFGLKILPSSPALVPFLLDNNNLEVSKPLAGIALDVVVTCNKVSFFDSLLFTHKGLSGPAILQISSYWQAGRPIQIDLLPKIDLFEHLQKNKIVKAKMTIQAILTSLLPKKLALVIAKQFSFASKSIAECSKNQMQQCANRVNRWQVTPSGTEGYRVAEVSRGGVDSRELSSKTMECLNISGLYFVGEVVDVTGQLGGYNLQWAWSSGWVAGQNA
ncbi:MAG: NAD(P)/FAD-dependent oxidoreductase [Magnetococcales bacterium]|nr:NAD(P)/FAD-dependent oxidoreductase [Magnetococcales bacterium]